MPDIFWQQTGAAYLQKMRRGSLAQPPGTINISVWVLVSLHSSVEICTSARATPLEDSCKKALSFSGSWGEFFSCFVHLYFALASWQHFCNMRSARVLLIYLWFVFHFSFVGLELCSPSKKEKKPHWQRRALHGCWKPFLLNLCLIMTNQCPKSKRAYYFPSLAHNAGPLFK